METNHFARQYAYKGQSSLQYKPPPLSRAQAAPLAYQGRTQYTHSSGHFNPPSAHNVLSNFPVTPRPQSRFKPAKILYTTANQSTDPVNSSNLQRATDQELKKLGSMGPPPHRQRQETKPYQIGINGDSKNNIPPITTNRFLPSSNGQTSSVPTMNSRRFLPPATHIRGAQHVPNGSTNVDNTSIGNGRRNVR
ncbi:hypothetical protein APHAL10511_001033 [Amanita phalloides]|nr:hypothetical protein APHAL10511_001033 [Amanita phalloides]